MSSQTYSTGTLKNFCVSVALKYGIGEKEAHVLADSLLFADKRNVSSHGIVRLPLYMEKVDAGIVNLKAEMPFTKNLGAAWLMDAQNGLGQLAGHKAMQKSCDLAGQYGIGMVAVSNSNHFGTGAWFSMLAVERGQIGIAMANASPAIAPFGTATPLLGTNPLSIAVPAKDRTPIVLDMAMSTVARGKIRLSAMKKEKIPLDWGLDAQGNQTDDPNEALKGSLVPIGGVKGSALSLIVDLICGVLTDTSLTGEVKNITDMSGPSRTGHAFMAVNIENFMTLDKFTGQVDAVINHIKSLTPKGGSGNIYMAGEIEYNIMREREQNGILLDDAVVESLNKLADKTGVPKL